MTIAIVKVIAIILILGIAIGVSAFKTGKLLVDELTNKDK